MKRTIDPRVRALRIGDKVTVENEPFVWTVVLLSDCDEVLVDFDENEADPFAFDVSLIKKVDKWN